jgi:hypothetical protein
MLQIEPKSFSSLFDVLYWSITSLTTGGYIDVIKDKKTMMIYDGRKRYE